ncbi:putative exported lectin [Lysobacter dokdonensis DS-58]|uniref:Putative exported lectin n=1 Tax=Lysobacter dokdonensis DS-58 TaxID=1300345 RepID=A0A0A2WIQ0_9GAMM|nr:hypothetical protein [Lysobacter dokdonensis]KGQ20071.1 putative exported lectin [Lysobacter dokdonensis DS-58]
MHAKPMFACLTLALACGACTQRDAASTDTVAPSTAAPATTTAMPATASTYVPPPGASTVIMPMPSSTVAAPGGVMPAAGAITFAGFGPAHWGASEEQVRQSWGKDLDDMPKAHDGCYYLFPEPRRPDGYRLAFMMEAGQFGRIDVRTPDIVAPGGGKVGMQASALKALYPGMTEMPHKYVEGGKVLRIPDPKGGKGVLVFEVEPSGKATDWRIGVPPQVDYVEGCS